MTCERLHGDVAVQRINADSNQFLITYWVTYQGETTIGEDVIAYKGRPVPPRYAALVFDYSVEEQSLINAMYILLLEREDTAEEEEIARIESMIAAAYAKLLKVYKKRDRMMAKLRNADKKHMAKFLARIELYYKRFHNQIHLWARRKYKKKALANSEIDKHFNGVERAKAQYFALKERGY